MCIFVISLESDLERRAKFAKQFPENYPALTFINAVDGRALSSTEYFSLVKPNLYEHNRLLSPTEVGCALSHMHIYEKIIASNAPAIVLEDDIIGSDEQLNLAKTLLSEVKSNEVIFLGGYESIQETNKIYVTPCTTDILFDNPMYEVDKHSTIYLGMACCYVIGVDAAKTILESQQNTLKLADNWYENTLDANVKPTFKFTPLFKHPEHNGQQKIANSNIEAQRKSLYYKKTYQLFLDSIFLHLKIQRLMFTVKLKQLAQTKNISVLSELYKKNEYE